MQRREIRKAILERVAEQLDEYLEMGGQPGPGQSPIEHAFMRAMSLWTMFTKHDGTELLGSHPDRFDLRPALKIGDKLRVADFRDVLTFAMQVPVGRYKADFAINADSAEYVDVLSDSPGTRHYLLPTIIVECDGHDFHERTPEQAMHDRSRDREMQAAGYRVMRFTGREIHRDVCGCVEQVYDLIATLAAEARRGGMI